MEIIPFPFVPRARRNELIAAMRDGKLFIYPTDTIYGIGCDARNEQSVRRIKRLKKRDARKPVSIIAPSKEWIRTHVQVTHPIFMNRLPGPYTFIWEKKRPAFLQGVAPGKNLGVRMPDHPFLSLVKAARIPFVTTSVNISGEPPIRNIAEIPMSIARKVDYIIDAGVLDHPPSKLYDLTGKRTVRLR